MLWKCIYFYHVLKIDVMSDDISKQSIIKVARKLIDRKGYGFLIDDIDLEESDILKLMSGGYLKKGESVESDSAILEDQDDIRHHVIFVDKKLYEDFHKTINEERFDWAEKLLLKYLSPLKPIFFNPRFVQIVRYDPNYSIHWNGYRMEVHPNNDDCSIDLHLKDLCIGYDSKKDEPVLSLFLDDILSLKPIERGLLRPYYISEDSNCEMAEQNIENLFEGNCYSLKKLDIYQIILSGIKIVNEISIERYELEIFKTDYDERSISFFSPLFYPTKRNWATFIISAAVIFVDSINTKQLRKFIWKNREDVKITNVAKGFLERNENIFKNKSDFNTISSISLLELFFCHSANCEYIIKVLKDIWDTRSGFSHKYYEDEYGIEYHEKQDIILIRIYLMIRYIIDSLDPDRSFFHRTHDGGFFINQYELWGTVNNGCGFNRPRSFDKYSSESKEFVCLNRKNLT